MTALLYSVRWVVLIYTFVTLAFSVVSYMQLNGMILIRTSWRDEMGSYPDAFMYLATIGIIFTVTWLFNRQLHAAYLHARLSEQKVQQQSDQLEQLVEKRTEALRQEHFQRLADLHRFAVYGKEASGLLHDILNPLNALSIEIKQQKGASKKSMRGANQALHRLEQLVTGARRHLKRQRLPEEFVLEREVRAVCAMLQHKARPGEVTVEPPSSTTLLYADPVLVYKILQNVIANAVDACLEAPLHRRVVRITCAQTKEGVTVTVADTGIGMSASQLKRVFDPLLYNET